MKKNLKKLKIIRFSRMLFKIYNNNLIKANIKKILFMKNFYKNFKVKQKKKMKHGLVLDVIKYLQIKII